MVFKMDIIRKCISDHFHSIQFLARNPSPVSAFSVLNNQK